MEVVRKILKVEFVRKDEQILMDIQSKLCFFWYSLIR